jgi:hypothetical protein
VRPGQVRVTFEATTEAVEAGASDAEHARGSDAIAVAHIEHPPDVCAAARLDAADMGRFIADV